MEKEWTGPIGKIGNYYGDLYIMEYKNKYYGSILPAKMSGKVWNDYMFGSQIDRRCRELREGGHLRSKKEGRFTRFYLVK